MQSTALQTLRTAKPTHLSVNLLCRKISQNLCISKTGGRVVIQILLTCFSEKGSSNRITATEPFQCSSGGDLCDYQPTQRNKTRTCLREYLQARRAEKFACKLFLSPTLTLLNVFTDINRPYPNKIGYFQR